MILTPFEKGLVAHLVADWVLQTDWMARNKLRLRHPAAWTHASIHAVCLSLALGWQAGLILAIVHMLIDTRVPVDWWMRVVKKCKQVPETAFVGIWLDQTLHIICIAAWVALVRS